MHDNNLHTVPIGDNVDILEDSDASRAVTGSKLSLFSKQASEDFVDTITCFAMHPHKAEVVLATQKGVLRHYAMTDSLLDDFQRIQNPTSLNSGGEKRPQSDDATAAAAAGANCLRAFRAHQMPILTMNFDPTGSLVATGGADRRVCVWDIYRGYCTHSFRDHTDILHSVQFHPDGERLQLFSTAEDHTVRVFDLRDSRCVAVFDQAHVSVPTSLAFRQSDGYLMASTGRDKVNTRLPICKHYPFSMSSVLVVATHLLISELLHFLLQLGIVRVQNQLVIASSRDHQRFPSSSMRLRE